MGCLLRLLNFAGIALGVFIGLLTAGGALLFGWLMMAWLAQLVGLVDNAESLLWCGGVFTC